MNDNAAASEDTRDSRDSGVAAPPRTRIQREKRAAILEAGLTVFSEAGFKGATLDRIASEAGLSEPNLLYYFPSKEAIYEALLRRLLDTWLDPLKAVDPAGEPVDEILGYVQRKLEMARDFPRESRLFATEIIQGAPQVLPVLQGELRALVDEMAGVIDGWVAAGRIAPVDARHLLFSIWAQTQHYADFDVQVQAVLGQADFDGAARHLQQMFRRMLAV